ncbi:MAG: REP-associated tyrosine transposase [Sphingomonadales bacterium]|jgi:putative transposase|nr:REP-associated tyrosine transposase [Sphingomonadales bacterium]
MPRSARLVLPEIPHHVTQRGSRCERTFLVEADYAFYLELLRHWCRKAGTAIWAWCLMPNHVHLILVPAGVDGLRAALAPLHRRYSWEINQREGWHGHLWQDRFASFPMDEAHLHACLAYVELNPVRARLVARPEDWKWSSARSHLGLAPPGLVDLDPARARIDDWRSFLDAGLDEADHKAIRAAERSGRWRTSKPRTAAPDAPQS